MNEIIITITIQLTFSSSSLSILEVAQLFFVSDFIQKSIKYWFSHYYENIHLRHIAIIGTPHFSMVHLFVAAR